MPPGESHVSRISKEYYVNYFNSSDRELGLPVAQQEEFECIGSRDGKAAVLGK